MLNINKPKGITSFDVIRHLKRLYPEKKLKIGHLGTLDPFAQGVLLIGINGATRIMPYFSSLSQKHYIAEGEFGRLTDTLDDTGSEQSCREYAKLDYSSEQIQWLLEENFLGKISQAIPYYSATKHEGKPLYSWAKDGVFIEKEPVEREIYHIKFLNLVENKFIFEVSASGGTYIRQLFKDISAKLGQDGILTGLTRSIVGSSMLENSVELEKLSSWSDVLSHRIEPDEVLKLNEIVLCEEKSKFVLNGQPITPEQPLEGPCWLKNRNGLLGLGLAGGAKIAPKIVWQNTSIIPGRGL